MRRRRVCRYGGRLKALPYLLTQAHTIGPLPTDNGPRPAVAHMEPASHSDGYRTSDICPRPTAYGPRPLGSGRVGEWGKGVLVFGVCMYATRVTRIGAAGATIGHRIFLLA